MTVTSLKHAVFISLMLLAAAPCSAELLSLDDAVSEALVNNPELRAAAEDIQAVSASRWDEVLPSYPQLFFEYEGVPEGEALSNFEGRKIGLAQSFDLPGKYFAASGKNRLEQKSTMLYYEALKNDIQSDVRKRYCEVLYHREKERLYEEIASLSEKMLAMARARVLAGESAPYDTLRAKVDLVDIESLVLAAGRDKENALYKLKLLLGRTKDAPVDVSGNLLVTPISLDPDELKALAMESRPELRKAMTELEISSLDRKLVKYDHLPSFELRYFGHSLPNSPTPDNWGGGLGLSLPLWGIPKATSAVKAAGHRRDAAGWRIETVKRKVLAEVENAWSGLALAENQLRKYRESALGEADELVRIAARSYEEGEMGYYETAEAYRSMYRTRATYTDALYSWHSAMIELERAVGTAVSAR